MAIRTLSAAYFVGELLITNVSGTTTTEQANLFPLNLAIAKHVPIFLKGLLGETLYDAYVAGIASPTDKWTALNNKIYYTDTALTALGTGLSPAANYVYFRYWQNQSTVTLQNGEGHASHENFTLVGIGHKMVAAWNEMVRMNEELIEWLDDNADTYTEWDKSEVDDYLFTRITQC